MRARASTTACSSSSPADRWSRLVVEGPRAIAAFRQLAGGTDPVEKAAHGQHPRRLRPGDPVQPGARLRLAGIRRPGDRALVPEPVTEARRIGCRRRRRERRRRAGPCSGDQRRPRRSRRRCRVRQRLRRRPGHPVAAGRRGRGAGRVRRAGDRGPTSPRGRPAWSTRSRPAGCIAVAANRARRLIGVGFLRPGRGSQQHTGHIELILLDPDHTRAGLGARLVNRLAGAGRAVRGWSGWTCRFPPGPAWRPSSARSASPNGVAGRAGTGWRPVMTVTTSCWESR